MHINLKIKGNKITGKSEQEDPINGQVTKIYTGTFNPKTREVRIDVSYNYGQKGVYTGILGKDGEDTRLRMEVTQQSENVSNARVGDYCYVGGITKWN